MSVSSSRADIVIIGGGIAGLACARHLAELGYAKTLVLSAKAPVSDLAAGWVMSSHVDHFTRISHAHGLSFAREFASFSGLAKEQLLSFMEERSLACRRGNRWRILMTEPEAKEAALAAEQAEWLHSDQRPPFVLPKDGIGYQVEQRGAATVDVAGLMSSLSYGVRIEQEKVVSVEEARGGVVVRGHGSEWCCEVAVLACHLGTRGLVPGLAEAFVPVAEQWCEIETASPHGIPQGDVLSLNNGYEILAARSDTKLCVTAGRYLRKQAGIGIESAEVSDKVTDFTMQLASRHWGLRARLVGEPVVGLDCRPCDELPIIGPMFGQDRILLAGGFMGQGLSWGFAAGRCLAELIVKGESAQLPDRFWPKRLRSLPESI